MKNSLVILTFVVIVSYLVYNDPSDTYWKSIGPSWDKMLNPCNYEKCE